MERSEFRVLVLDDEPDWRRANEKTLSRAGFTVVAASTGAEALAAAEGGGFHMAVLDINLPDCDGSELVEKVKALSPETTVIMLTGFATIEKAGVAAAGGSADILEKIADNPDERSLADDLLERAEEVFGGLSS